MLSDKYKKLSNALIEYGTKLAVRPHVIAGVVLEGTIVAVALSKGANLIVSCPNNTAARTCYNEVVDKWRMWLRGEIWEDEPNSAFSLEDRRKDRLLESKSGGDETA